MGPGSAEQRRSALKTRVNALMALHRARDTVPAVRIPPVPGVPKKH